MITKLATCTCIAALFLTGAANAEEGFYAGFGFGLTDMESQAEFGGTSEGALPMVALTAGYRAEADRFFYGAEIDADMSLDGNLDYQGTECGDGFANGPYYCEHDATLRLRGVIGTDLTPQLEGFATLGYGVMWGKGAVAGDGSTDNGVNSGVTVSLGLQHMMQKGKLRYELIYDDFGNTGEKPADLYKPDYQAVSLRLMYLMSF
ncbi:outer membrane protein [Actibacterium sp. D379-3]